MSLPGLAEVVTDGCWSKSGFSLFSLSLLSSSHLIITLTAVLMVTLSAKSKGLDFYRIYELSTVPALETQLSLSLSLSLFSCTFVFLSTSTECFIPPFSMPQDPFVSLIQLLLPAAHLSLLLVESTVPSSPPPGFVSSSRNLNHDWALSVTVYKSNLHSNPLYWLQYYSSFRCFTVSSNCLRTVFSRLC